MEWLRERLPDILTHHKVVIWSRFRASQVLIKAALEELGVRYSHLNSEQSTEARQEQIVEFQNDPENKVFVSPIQIGGSGITLTAADYAIFCDKSYNFADIEQASDRIHRIGQTKHCHYISLVTENSIEEMIEENLKMKRGMLDLTLTELKSILKGGFDK